MTEADAHFVVSLLFSHGLAVRTRQKLLVDLAEWYICHSIALAALMSDLGDRLDNLLAPETRAVLASLETPKPNHDWLQHMRSLLSYQRNQPEKAPIRPNVE